MDSLREGLVKCVLGRWNRNEIEMKYKYVLNIHTKGSSMFPSKRGKKASGVGSYLHLNKLLAETVL